MNLFFEALNRSLDNALGKQDADDLVDKYGNPNDGSRLINCCFPDCGCDGARLCQAENGPSFGASALNVERGSFVEKPKQR